MGDSWIVFLLIGMLLPDVSAGNNMSLETNKEMRCAPVELFQIDGLSRFREMTPAQAKTHVTISRDKDNVYVAVDCREPLAVRSEIKHNGDAVWGCDNVEIFFGGIGEHPWYRQFVVSAGGGRQSIYADLSEWSSNVSTGKNGWKADVTIPLRLFGSSPDGMRFNILRQRTAGRELQTWSNIIWGHDVERFRKIPFALPDDYAVHGPWLFQPGTTQIGIGWESAGTCVTMLEYRERGTLQYQTFCDSSRNGIRRGDSALHKVWLCGLKPNTEYEYKIKGASGSFRTLKEKMSNFSIFITSDLHDRSAYLAELLRRTELQNCDFAIYLGDMVTSSLDKSTYYDGFLDASVKNWKKPFVYVRGNHEYRGRSAESYFDLFGTVDKKGYFTVQHGGVFFIFLDLEGDCTPDDGKPYYEEQADFLVRTISSPEFQNADFRIVMGHVPPLSPREDGKLVAQLLKKLPPKSIDLFIGGHKHRCAYVPANGTTIDSVDSRFEGKPAYGMSFPVLVGDNGGIIRLERKGDELNIRIFDELGAEFRKSPLRIPKTQQPSPYF